MIQAAALETRRLLKRKYITYRRCPSKSGEEQAEEKIKQMAMPTGTQVVTCMAEQCVSGTVGGVIGGAIASGHHDRPVLRLAQKARQIVTANK